MDCLWPDSAWQISWHDAMHYASETTSCMISKPWYIVQHLSSRGGMSLMLDDMLDATMGGTFGQAPLRKIRADFASANPGLALRKPPSFGVHGMPADPSILLRASPRMAANELEAMGCRMINAVHVTGFGRDSALIAIPTIIGIPGVDDMVYHVEGPGPGCMALRMFVRLVWLILRAATGVSLQIASVSHKANFKEGDGVLQWVKHCSSNREAVVLAESFDVVLHADGENFSRKPRRAPLYVYVGGGFEEQPEDVATIVVKCHGLDVTASVLVACALITLTQTQHEDVPMKLDQDIIYDEQDKQYDHEGLKASAINIFRDLNFKACITFENLIAELLVKKPSLQLTKLPTVDTALPEQIDDDDEQCFGDLLAERVAAAPSIPPHDSWPAGQQLYQ